MTLAALLELAIVGGSLACGAVSAVLAQYACAAARADRLALRLARARDDAFADAARRLAAAARAGVDAVRDEIARGAREVAPALDAVLLYEEHEGALRCVYASGERVAHFAGSCIARDDENALPVRALAAGHRVALAEAGTKPIHPGDGSALAVPLALESGRSCVLVVSARTALERDAIDRLVTLIDHAAPAYVTSLEREDDRRRAEYDGLTGLLTPRAFRTRLAALVERARVVPTARLALLFVDTDRFKEWNDSYGHASGDALLRELARLLRTAARGAGDLVARNGGDEFCLVFTETEKSTAIERAEALRARIVAADFGPLHGKGATGAVRITASIGVAAFPADADGANALLERADAAMYHSKRTGRDGVSYFDVDGAMTRLDPALV